MFDSSIEIEMWVVSDAVADEAVDAVEQKGVEDNERR